MDKILSREILKNFATKCDLTMVKKICIQQLRNEYSDRKIIVEVAITQKY